jgi:hypothetical protein
LDLFEARAQFDGPERTVHIRTAEHGGRIYLDLADEHWRAVQIGADAWRMIESPPVRFRRPAGMLPLPPPERRGSIEALNSLLNLSSRSDFVLIVAWLFAALRSGEPYPLLAISGEPGSAKTVLSKLLKALIDPNAAPGRALSREQRELMIAAWDFRARLRGKPQSGGREHHRSRPARQSRTHDDARTDQLGPGAPQTYCACAQRVLAKMPWLLVRGHFDAQHSKKSLRPA